MVVWSRASKAAKRKEDETTYSTTTPVTDEQEMGGVSPIEWDFSVIVESSSCYESSLCSSQPSFLCLEGRFSGCRSF